MIKNVFQKLNKRKFWEAEILCELFKTIVNFINHFYFLLARNTTYLYNNGDILTCKCISSVIYLLVYFLTFYMIVYIYFCIFFTVNMREKTWGSTTGQVKNVNNFIVLALKIPELGKKTITHSVTDIFYIFYIEVIQKQQLWQCVSF